ncbi:hypothetical protein ACFVXE_28005 [Streptomyces sp. NPDC058231]|uniref:hypothetical protein n=1 Tax=Streptomyces sp. NPDC058231 TaxID=3346392 RepID=UPI0036E13273
MSTYHLAAAKVAAFPISRSKRLPLTCPDVSVKRAFRYLDGPPVTASLIFTGSMGLALDRNREYLGHHDPGFTLRTYTCPMPSSGSRTRATVDRVFADDEPTGGRPGHGP